MRWMPRHGGADRKTLLKSSRKVTSGWPLSQKWQSTLPMLYDFTPGRPSGTTSVCRDTDSVDLPGTSGSIHVVLSLGVCVRATARQAYSSASVTAVTLNKRGGILCTNTAKPTVATGKELVVGHGPTQPARQLIRLASTRDMGAKTLPTIERRFQYEMLGYRIPKLASCVRRLK